MLTGIHNTFQPTSYGVPPQDITDPLRRVCCFETAAHAVRHPAALPHGYGMAAVHSALPGELVPVLDSCNTLHRLKLKAGQPLNDRLMAGVTLGPYLESGQVALSDFGIDY